MKRNVKRGLAAGLVAVMGVSLLAGCGGSGTEKKEGTKKSGDKTVIRFWCHTNDAWTKSYKEVIAKFEEANPEYTVEISDYPYSDYAQKVQTSLMSDSEGADVYEMWGGWALDFASTGALSALPDDLTKTVEENYYAPPVGAYRHDGVYYGIPIEYNLEYGGMVVNKKIFEENNLTYPTTWQELKDVSSKVAKKENGVITMRGFDFVDEDAMINNYFAMILQQGGTILDENNDIHLDTPEGIKAMEELKGMIDAGYTDTTAFTEGAGTSSFVFEDKGTMGSIGSWAISDGVESYGLELGVDFDYVPVPQYGNKLAFTAESGWGFVVPEKTEVKDAAWDLIRFISEPENLKQHNLACSQLPPTKELAEDENFKKEIPDTAFLLDLLESGQWIGPYNTTSLKEALDETLISICQDGKDIKQALMDCSEKMIEGKIE